MPPVPMLGGTRVSIVNVARTARLRTTVGTGWVCAATMWGPHGHNGPGGQLCGSQLPGQSGPQSAQSAVWSWLAAARSDDTPLHVAMIKKIVIARSSRPRSETRRFTRAGTRRNTGSLLRLLICVIVH